jgi:hypothetical protein
MLRACLEGLDRAEAGAADSMVVELTTFGGDADIGRRIALEVRLFAERTGRRLIFFGKTTVYSSGVTIMAAFPREERWLSRDTTLLIHGRSLAKTLELSGPLSLERVRVEAVLAEIDAGLRLEREDFARLVEGTRADLSEVLRRAPAGWYMAADEALALELVAGMV